MISHISVFRNFTMRSIPTLALALLAWPLAAQYAPPSKPFLEKNGFYLESAGFRVRLANDEASRRALNALPPHRFVMHKAGGTVHLQRQCRQLQELSGYLAQPLPGMDDVSPDCKSQAGALLMDEPAYFGAIDNDDSLADYFRDYL